METQTSSEAAARAGDLRDLAAGGQPEADPADDGGWVAQATDALGHAIGRLYPDEQRMIIGHYYEERSIAELAELHGLTPPQVHGLIQDALRKLRRMVLH